MYLLAVLKVQYVISAAGGSLNQNMYNQRSEMERGIMGVVALQHLCQR